MKTLVLFLVVLTALNAQASQERGVTVVKVLQDSANSANYESFVRWESIVLNQVISSDWNYQELQDRAAPFFGEFDIVPDFADAVNFVQNNPDKINELTGLSLPEVQDELDALPAGYFSRELVQFYEGQYVIDGDAFSTFGDNWKADVYLQIGLHNWGITSDPVKLRAIMRSFLKTDGQIQDVLTALDRVSGELLTYKGVRLRLDDSNQFAVISDRATIGTNMGAIPIGDYEIIGEAKFTFKGWGLSEINIDVSNKPALVVGTTSFRFNKKIYLYENGDVCGVQFYDSGVKLVDDNAVEQIMNTNIYYAFDHARLLVTSNGALVTGDDAIAYCGANYSN